MSGRMIDLGLRPDASQAFSTSKPAYDLFADGATARSSVATSQAWQQPMVLPPVGAEGMAPYQGGLPQNSASTGRKPPNQNPPRAKVHLGTLFDGLKRSGTAATAARFFLGGAAAGSGVGLIVGGGLLIYDLATRAYGRTALDNDSMHAYVPADPAVTQPLEGYLDPPQDQLTRTPGYAQLAPKHQTEPVEGFNPVDRTRWIPSVNEGAVRRPKLPAVPPLAPPKIFNTDIHLSTIDPDALDFDETIKTKGWGILDTRKDFPEGFGHTLMEEYLRHPDAQPDRYLAIQGLGQAPSEQQSIVLTDESFQILQTSATKTLDRLSSASSENSLILSSAHLAWNWVTVDDRLAGAHVDARSYWTSSTTFGDTHVDDSGTANPGLSVPNLSSNTTARANDHTNAFGLIAPPKTPLILDGGSIRLFPDAVFNANSNTLDLTALGQALIPPTGTTALYTGMLRSNQLGNIKPTAHSSDLTPYSNRISVFFNIKPKFFSYASR